jgi:hypothetical protein
MLAGKAYLLFQKFLIRGAYRYVDCCPKPLSQQMQQALNEATSELPTTKLDNDFFDEVLRLAEDVMLEDLFKPFFASKFYKEYPK